MERRMSISGPASVESVTMVEIAMAKVAVIKIAVIKVAAIDDRSAVRDIRVVVVDYSAAVPVVSPVMPSPPKSSEEADAKSKTERDCGAGKKDSGNRNPAGVGNHRCSVHEPRIIGRYVDNIGVGRFDDDGVALRAYILLLIAVQLPRLAGLLPHLLDSIRYILFLIGICLAKG